MQIFRTRKYLNQLTQILEFIAKDNVFASEVFYQKLDVQIESLTSNSFKYMQSFYSDDINVRDMTFKKYIIQYKTYVNKVSILSIFNQNKPKKLAI